jgi:predicted DNA-binding transcriptional regulator AlpA
MDRPKADTTERKAFTIDEFCAAHRISRAMFYKLGKQNRGPRLKHVGKRVIITDEAAAEWRSTEAS